MVACEVETGIQKSLHPEKRIKQLADLLDTARVLPFDRACARSAATVHAELEALGKPTGPIDTIVAGTALAHDAILVTHNTDELARVPDLRVVDWY